MSRSAHAQSTYKLRRLPTCSKCKIQFILVMVSYENKPKPVWEWECPKCHKCVPKHKLKENQPGEFEKFLANWCKEDESRKQNDRRVRNRSTALRRLKELQPNNNEQSIS